MKSIISRMEQDLKDRGVSPHTVRAYLYHVSKFAEHFGRPLSRLGERHVRQYCRHLGDQLGLGCSSQHLFVASIRFLFVVTLSRPAVVASLKPPRRPKTLPVIMRKDEVLACLTGATNERDKAFIMLGFGAGLRVREVARLRVEDIQSKAGVLHIRASKGKKDRMVMLSQPLLAQLRRYWAAARPGTGWLFPGGRGGKSDRPISTRHIRRAWTEVQATAGLERRYKYHSLRHCFATYLLDEGVDLRTVQILLGHARMSSTLRYVLVQPRHVSAVRSPLESLIGPVESGTPTTPST